MRPAILGGNGLHLPKMHCTLGGGGGGEGSENAVIIGDEVRTLVRLHRTLLDVGF